MSWPRDPQVGGGAATVRYLLGQQRKTGGWSWHPRGVPDSNDTAVVIQACEPQASAAAR